MKNDSRVSLCDEPPGYLYLSLSLSLASHSSGWLFSISR